MKNYCKIEKCLCADCVHYDQCTAALCWDCDNCSDAITECKGYEEEKD